MDINPNLFGAMMSALNNYANMISEGGMMGFELKQQQIHIFKHLNLLFVASCSKKEKEKKILTTLEEISVKFIDKFQKLFEKGDFMTAWDGEVSQFSNFGVDIKGYLVK